MGGVGKARNAAGSSSSSHACFVLTRDAAFTLDLTFPYPYPRLARARVVVSSSALVALPFPFPSALRARVRAAARAAAVALASAARSAFRSVSSPSDQSSSSSPGRASRPASSPPSGGVVGPDASGGIAIAFRAAPAGREGRAAPGGGGGLDAPVTTTLSSGAGRARFARNWRSSAREGRGLPRGAAAKPSRDAAVDASRASGSVARVSASGLSPDSTTRVRAAGPALTILTVSEDARPAPDPSAPSFAVRVYLARSTFALANVVLELVRHFSGMAAGGGWGPMCGRG